MKEKLAVHNHYNRYTERDISVIKKYVIEYGYEAIASRLGRSTGSIQRKAHQLGILRGKKKKRSKFNWTPELDKLMYTMPQRKLAKKLNIHHGSVASRKYWLKKVNK